MLEVSCSALLFDMDGVLIDSTPAVTRVWWRWAKEHGFEPEEVVRRAHGRPSISTVRDFLPNANAEQENQEVERREIEDLEGVVLLPGAKELLNSLPPDRWTVVTSATRALAEVRLRVAGLPIPPRLITSNDIQNGKPDPEPYLKAASALGVSPGECIVVEDVPAGIRSGKAAGAKVIGLTTSVEAAALHAAGADWLLRSCANIAVTELSSSVVLRLTT